ncbi:GTPase Era [Pseudolysobacter antarcticus]|uniref:GTPase Era n=1 Tax=Pseudolysobacter antarcticus TaxID=2511995 RepID=A0A411HJD9_9GAMM|nr:GTPase Era [Pseudolysobacter antarcticus]QBB70642.1 GTPase Era [Pseudolysobacter antarcticus]
MDTEESTPQPIEPAKSDQRCGLVALVGRPNVGKSTLLNRLIGYRLSIVSPKPQTTRHRILGIANRGQGQIIYLDTPGIHQAGKSAMNRQLNRVAQQALDEADVVIQVIEAMQWRDEDQQVYQALENIQRPRLLAINKTDTQKSKQELLPFIAKVTGAHAFDEIYLISARRGDGLDRLEQGILKRLPQAEPMFAEDEITDRSERFLAAERVREQLMRLLNQELPYSTTVEIEQYQREGKMLRIGAVIWVEREGQKAIVIGAGGEQLKRIGTAARLQLESLLETKVFLGLFVRVRENWSQQDAALKQFGYTD